MSQSTTRTPSVSTSPARAVRWRYTTAVQAARMLNRIATRARTGPAEAVRHPRLPSEQLVD